MLKIATAVVWFALSLSVVAAEPKSAATYEPPAKQETGKTDDYKKQPEPPNKNSSNAKPQDEQGQQHFGQRFWDFTLTDVLLAVFTAVLAGVGIKQWDVLRQSVAAATKAADAAVTAANAIPALERPVAFSFVVLSDGITTIPGNVSTLKILGLHGIEWVILRVFRASGACR